MLSRIIIFPLDTRDQRLAVCKRHNLRFTAISFPLAWAKVNTTTMAVIQNLQAAMHYPVANTELIQARTRSVGVRDGIPER